MHLFDFDMMSTRSCFSYDDVSLLEIVASLSFGALMLISDAVLQDTSTITSKITLLAFPQIFTEMVNFAGYA